MNDSDLMTRKEAAVFLRVSPKFLADNATSSGAGKVPFYRVGDRTRYSLAALKQWLTSTSVNAA